MKIVILYSGGLDSFLLYEYAQRVYPDADVKCIYYKHGAESEEQEINSLPTFVDVRTIDWLDENHRPLSKKDDPYAGNIYIPGRNLIFSSLAACQELPSEIWMGTVWDEDNSKGTDKNEFFRSSTSDLLSYVLSPFIDGVKIRFPFVENSWTKLDCLQWALGEGISKERISNTISCWNQKDGKACGICKQCFKRRLNFLLSGINEQFQIDPINSESGKTYIRSYLSSASDNRDEENVRNLIRDVYNRNLLEPNIKELVKELLNEY